MTEVADPTSKPSRCQSSPDRKRAHRPFRIGGGAGSGSIRSLQCGSRVTLSPAPSQRMNWGCDAVRASGVRPGREARRGGRRRARRPGVRARGAHSRHRRRLPVRWRDRADRRGTAGRRAAAGPASRGPVGSPVARPGKIVCIGLNYADHAAETGAARPAEPVAFLKAPNTVVGPDDDVLVRAAAPGPTTRWNSVWWSAERRATWTLRRRRPA